ncbi:helix-turn-helix domain-containing protein, partial [Burkholderia cenocepacia]|uniref:helix-turn-helix domain-containing protein n=1 Tax=Burkholderia cenocepacia TaxID=95486 RepID=UPI000981852A
MTKYNEQFRQRIVDEYLAGGIGIKSLAARHGVGRTVIRRWVASYREHGSAGLHKKHTHYDAQFKLSVLQRMWQDELSYGQVSALFDIRGAGSVAGWERLYHKGGIDALSPRRRGRPRKMATSLPPKPTEAGTPDERSREELLKENEYLRAEVAYLKKLDALL